MSGAVATSTRLSPVSPQGPAISALARVTLEEVPALAQADPRGLSPSSAYRAYVRMHHLADQAAPDIRILLATACNPSLDAATRASALARARADLVQLARDQLRVCGPLLRHFLEHGTVREVHRVGRRDPANPIGFSEARLLDAPLSDWDVQTLDYLIMLLRSAMARITNPGASQPA